MHKYERFIIYPLLIVALFYGFTGEQTMTIAQDVKERLTVKEISIVNDNGEEVVNMGSNDTGGEIIVSDIMGLFEFKYGMMALTSENRRLFVDGSGLSMYEYDDDLNPSIESGYADSDSTKLFEIGVYNEFPFADFYNPNGDKLIHIGADTNDHGLINVYDKYGDDWRSYGFR